MQRPAPETPVPASSDEETGIKLATPEKRIRALRVRSPILYRSLCEGRPLTLVQQKKELLQKQLEDKLMVSFDLREYCLCAGS